VKLNSILSVALGVVAVGFAGTALRADPVDEKLIIDGEREMITRTAAPPNHPFDEVLSGWLYRTPETRALEADSFQNPGMLYVERGEEVWNTVDGAAGKSCASCHDDAAQSMKDVGAHYPKWNAAAGKPFNLELQIDACRKNNMQAEPYKFDAADQKALVTYIKYQSQGTPVAVDLAQGEMQSWWDNGKDLYYTRTGQLNLSCATCHEQNNGKYIRADHLSQGQINGFPTYRLKNAKLNQTHDRFRGCIRDTRGHTFDAGSPEFVALELYVASRGNGLSVEGPSVRN